MNKRKQRELRTRLGQALMLILCISTGLFFLIMAYMGVDVNKCDLGVLFVSYCFLCAGITSLMVGWAAR